MTTVNVTETIKQAGRGVAGVIVTVRLYVSADDPAAPGYDPTNNQTIADVGQTKTNAAGVWEMDLEPNDNITDPENTVYQIDYFYPKSKLRPEPVYITVETSPSTQRVEDIKTTAPDDLPVRVRLSDYVTQVIAHGNSRGKLGATSADWRWPHRYADQLRVPLRDEMISGAKMLKTGIVQGGWVTCVQNSPPVARSYGAQVYPAMPGVVTLQDYINDIEDYAADDTITLALREALKLNTRALSAWFLLSCFFLHDASSTGQTYPTGSWATTTDTSRNIGASFTSSGTSGAQVRVATSANAAGYFHDLFFLTDRTGGSLPATDSIAFTLDGTTIYPEGYSSSVAFDTDSINPSGVGNQGLAVARIEIPNDAASHVILATCSTGGCAYNGYGIEAIGRPIQWLTTARRSDAYTGYATTAKLASVNTDLDTVVDEFAGLGVVVMDVDAELAATAAYFADGLHCNDEGHARTSALARSSLDGIGLTSAQRRYV